MAELVVVDPSAPGRATARIALQTGGRGVFAEVTVVCARGAAQPNVHLGGSEFAWLRDVYGSGAWEWPLCDELRIGALEGARWAVDHCSPPRAAGAISIVIESIRALPIDSDYDAAFLATCLATWAGLGVDGAPRPSFRDGKLNLVGR
jgi:hypothetical protein